MNVVKLSEICTFSRGLTYSKSDEVDFSKNVVLRANNIDLDSNSLNLEDLRYIKDSIEIKKEKIVKKHSLIICTASGSKNHVGKVALITEDLGYAFGGFMGQLTPNNNCHPKFLYYILTSSLFKDFLMSLNDGTNINNLKFSDIENYELPLPNLEKQKEYVEKLDKTFLEIDLLEDNLMKLISLNETLLSAKINSELGAVWGSSGVKTLGDFGKISYGYTAKSSSSHIGPKYLRITDIQNKSVNWSEVPSCEISSEEKSKFLLSKGDIVFARTGATTGKSYLIDADVDAVFASYLIRIKPDPKELDSEFLYYFFQSAYYWDEIADGISGSAQGGFNASKLQAMHVSFPLDLKIQRDIVKRVREFEVELNRRMIKLLNEARCVSKLRQSILSSAFTPEEVLAG